jgi:hypothetical protein
MTTPDNIADAIDANARGPKRVQVGNQSVEQHPIADQIAADEYAKSQTAATREGFGIRKQRIVPTYP